MTAYNEKRGLKNIYEKLCLYYTLFLFSFNFLRINFSKQKIK